MRQFFFALVLALALTPTPSSAGFVASAISVALAASSAGAGFFAAVGAGLGFLSSTFAGKLIFGAVTSLVGQLFTEKPKAIKPSGIQTDQTTTGDVTPQKFVVGRYA